MTNTKNRNYAFRISENDLEKIKEKAAKARLTVTDYLTACALDKNIIVVEGLDELALQLKHIGNNINQLAMLAHQGRVKLVNLYEAEDTLLELHRELRRISKVVNAGGNINSD